MNKKILTLLVTLLTLGLFSISCSENPTDPTVDKNKGIEQFNGNTYVSEKQFEVTIPEQRKTKKVYMWISVKDGKVATFPNDNNTTPPTFDPEVYFVVSGSGTDYSFSIGGNTVKGSLKFSPDGSSVTLTYTENPGAPESMLNTPIVCNKNNL